MPTPSVRQWLHCWPLYTEVTPVYSNLFKTLDQWVSLHTKRETVYTNPWVDQSQYASVLARYHEKIDELTCVHIGVIWFVNLETFWHNSQAFKCILPISGVSFHVQFEYADAHYCTAVDMVNTDARQNSSVWAVSWLPIWLGHSSDSPDDVP